MDDKIKTVSPIFRSSSGSQTGVAYITGSRIRFGWGNYGNVDTVQEEAINSTPGEGAADLLKNFINENKIALRHLILSLPRTQVSIKYLILPAVDESELRQMVKYEANNLLPLRTEELVYDYAVGGRGPGDYSRLMLVVAPRETVLKHAAALKQAGLVPDEIGVSTVYLFRQFCSQNRPQGNYLLINVDDSFMEMVYISGQALTFSRAVGLSGKSETTKTVEDIEFTAAVLRDKDHPIDKVVLCGSGLDLDSLADGIRKNLAIDVEIDNRLGVIKGAFLKNGGCGPRINLLPEELKIERSKGTRRKTFAYLAMILLLNLSLLASIAFLRINAKRAYLVLLKTEIGRIDPRASGLQKKLASVQLLRDYVNSNRLTLWLLSEMYRVAPEGIDLSSLDIFNRQPQGTMEIGGQAKDSDAVLRFANALKETAFIKSADISRIARKGSPAEGQGVNFEIRSQFSLYK